MPAYVDIYNQILALGTYILIILAGVLLISLVFFRKLTNPVLVFFKKNTFLIAFLIGLGSLLSSLFYSEVVGFPPCELCLIQRVFLYPQVLIFGYLLFKPNSIRSLAIVETGLISACFGTLVSLYHVYIENGGSSSLACAAGGPGVVSCATIYVDQWGITIPVMALVASGTIILLVLNYFHMTKKTA